MIIVIIKIILWIIGLAILMIGMILISLPQGRRMPNYPPPGIEKPKPPPPPPQVNKL
jgi:hypothetical protein